MYTVAYLCAQKIITASSSLITAHVSSLDHHHTESVS